MTTDTGATTGSRTTRILGLVAVVGMALLLFYAFVVTPPDDQLGDSVRLMYVHVPTAVITYVAFAVTAVGSVAYLWKRSTFWDLTAGASAEIGVVFAGLTLVTGSIWGRPTWGTYWEWGDVRLVTTLVLFLLFVGYLALRQVPADPHVRSKRAAIVALVAVIDIPIVNRSVEWWENRTLHQKATVARLDPKIDDTMLFAVVLGVAVFAVIYVWMVIHRFRIAWLEREIEEHGLDAALEERRAEARAGVDAAVRVAGDGS